jgi:hypothetical protein
MVTSTKQTKLRLKRAFQELDSGLYDANSVKHAYMQLDVIASALRELHEEIFEDDDQLDPSEVFEKLAPKLDEAAPDLARALEKLSSRQWYDSNSEGNEKALAEAESITFELCQLLTDFLDPGSTANPAQGNLFGDDKGTPQ